MQEFDGTDSFSRWLDARADQLAKRLRRGRELGRLCRRVSPPDCLNYRIGIEQRRRGRRSDMSISTKQIGMPHPLWRPQRFAGGQFDDEIGHFVLGWPGVKRRETTAFTTSGKLGIMSFREISVISLQFSAEFGVCLPYHVILVARISSAVSNCSGGRRLMMFALVESTTGVVEGLRAATVSPQVSCALNSSIARQLECPITEEEFVQRASEWQVRFPTNRSVMEHSVISRLGS